MRQNCPFPTRDGSFLKQAVAVGVVIWVFCCQLQLVLAQAEPGKPKPPRTLSDHPGNIFLEGEEVSVRVPPDLPVSDLKWRVLDMEGRTVRNGELRATQKKRGENLPLGRLGVGYYRAEFNLAGDDQVVAWTAAAVLAPLRAPVPGHSPICVDSATSWFAADDPLAQGHLANLASLAGVNWIRDRARWRDLQTGVKTFAGRTTYDTAAEIQQEAGLRVLQVFHDTPPWARDGRSSGEFTRDLRHLHGFCKAMAQRFKGSVQSWEPWNEANVKNFGGHTVDEMCSWQKAAWLGFKAGDPDVIVGWNATAAAPTAQHTKGVLANETWPYFDTYNIHTYDWAHSYFDLWGPAREAACGRPLWITESDRGLQHLKNPPWYDLSVRDAQLKAEFMAQSYAQSLYAGASRHFHFILGHYYETNGVQFGLLRKDHTPRPAYVALAAAGRLLAGARCLGRWKPAGDVHVYAFRGEPDGVKRDVLVAWAEKDVDWPARGMTEADWSLPEEVACEGVFDYLGRSLANEVPAQLQSAPRYFVLPRGEAEKLPLEALAKQSQFRPGKPSPIVLQVVMPPTSRIRVEDKNWSEGHAYQFASGQVRDLTLVAYNFSDRAFSGRVTIASLPTGWRLSPQSWDVNLEPMAREILKMEFHAAAGAAEDGWVHLAGDFGAGTTAVVAFRMVEREGLKVPDH